MKKHYIIVAILLTCILGLSACGKETQTPNNPGNVVNGSSVENTDNSDSNNQVPNDNPTATPTEVPDTPTEAPTTTPTEVPEAPTEAPTATPTEGATVGGSIILGAYEQDNNTDNGAEPIEWKILAVDSDKMLVISSLCLDIQPFHTESVEITWEDCSLRQWLNDTFYSEAFTDNDKARILSTTIQNPDSHGFFTSDYIKNLTGRDYSAGVDNYAAAGGNATEDRVFLLSWEEAINYFATNADRMAEYSAYANSKYDGDPCGWLLRSPVAKERVQYVEIVNGNEGVMFTTSAINQLGGGSVAIRPAMWINVQ